eukprot:gene18027-24440_t
MAVLVGVVWSTDLGPQVDWFGLPDRSHLLSHYAVGVAALRLIQPPGDVDEELRDEESDAANRSTANVSNPVEYKNLGREFTREQKASKIEWGSSQMWSTGGHWAKNEYLSALGQLADRLQNHAARMLHSMRSTHALAIADLAIYSGFFTLALNELPSLSLTPHGSAWPGPVRQKYNRYVGMASTDTRPSTGRPYNPDDTAEWCGLLYQACYCEENVYKLITSLVEAGHATSLLELFVVFVSNPDKRESEGLVIWDYHVFLLQVPLPTPGPPLIAPGGLGPVSGGAGPGHSQLELAFDRPESGDPPVGSLRLQPPYSECGQAEEGGLGQRNGNGGAVSDGVTPHLKIMYDAARANIDPGALDPKDRRSSRAEAIHRAIEQLALSPLEAVYGVVCSEKGFVSLFS